MFKIQGLKILESLLHHKDCEDHQSPVCLQVFLGDSSHRLQNRASGTINGSDHLYEMSLGELKKMTV